MRYKVILVLFCSIILVSFLSLGSFDPTPQIIGLNPPHNSVINFLTVDFACFATDDLNIVNITLYGDFNGSWQAVETKDVSGTLNSTSFNKTLEDGIYSWNCLVYDNDSNSNWSSNNYSLIVNSSTPYFSVRNSTGGSAAWFNGRGDLNLEGNCSTSSSCIESSDSFVFKSSVGETVAYIDSSGNLCLEKGACSDKNVSCNPSLNAFIIKGGSVNLSYIDSEGGLCLTGSLNENI